MKTNVIVGKRSLLLAILVGALALAVYCNWYLSNRPQETSVTDVLTGSAMGQAMYVNADASSSTEDYFTTARNNRAKARQEAKEALDEIVNNVKSDSSAVADASAKSTAIAKSIETESNIETLIKAKGFADCVAVISDSSVNVIVKSSGLLPSDMVQIQEIAKEQTGFSLENIKIIESK